MALLDFLFKPVEIIKIDAQSSEIEDFKITDMAIQKAVSIYANVISTLEFKRFQVKGKTKTEVKNDLYYRLNIQPNVNENATSFWHRAITQLIYEGELLIIKTKTDDLLIADSFDDDEKVLYQKQYKNVVLGEVKLEGFFNDSEVLYFNIESLGINEAMNGYYASVGNLVNRAANDYRQATGRKYTFNIGADYKRAIGKAPTETDDGENYIKKIVTKLFTEDNVVVPLQPTEKLEEIGASNEPKSPDGFNSAVKSTLESIAISFGIPIDLFFGKTTEKSNAFDEFIATGLRLFINLIEDEMNRKLITKDEYLKGGKVKIDISHVKHYDVLSHADKIEKLIGVGFTHNEVRKMIGEEPVTDDMQADVRHFTLNFSSEQKGGE